MKQERPISTPIPTDQRYALSDDLKRRIAGDGDAVFQAIETRFGVEILSRLPGLTIRSLDHGDVQGAILFLDQLKLSIHRGADLDVERIRQMLSDSLSLNSYAPKAESRSDQNSDLSDVTPWSDASLKPILRNRYGQPVQAKTASQAQLVDAVEQNDLVLVNGPAGTGKTFLAVALAVSYLEEKRVERICLVRPAVEAGETLGYLPGDLKEKIAPYLRPMYDALNELLPPEKMQRYHEQGQIEVAPLAYMRGRTLKRAFIILDEAQNTTIPQMKMFLTRLGLRSKAIVAGDSSQSDLDARHASGFAHSLDILKGVEGISQIQFQARDVLRHRLVQDILTAYEEA